MTRQNKLNNKKLHPFTKMYLLNIEKAKLIREQIMQLNEWSYTTFYRKLRENNLTEIEAINVSHVLNIDVAEIDVFQNGFKKS